MEKLLYYVWTQRLWDTSQMQLSDGTPVEIIDTGRYNTGNGPDFFNAKIKIEGEIWAGNVEIHVNASDWDKHGHQNNAAYDSVIAHVVTNNDKAICRTSGELIPTIVLTYPEQLLRDYEFLISTSRFLPCGDRIHELSPILLSDWITALSIERLQQKSERIAEWLDMYTGSWEEVCYLSLSRSLGFGVNGDAFERLARSIPLRFLQKHADSLIQIEAFLFGQAGLLHDEISDDTYYSRLRNEYDFLRNKFQLEPMDETAWRFYRLRPANFPHQRIAALAKIIHDGFSFFMRICEATTTKVMRSIFEVYLTGYWDNHYTFAQTSPSGRKALGDSAIDILLINTVAPLLYTYGSKTGGEEYWDRALHLLEELRPEKNNIITRFCEAGIPAKNALDTQALIQLHKMYCEPHKCITCRIGHKLLSKNR